MFYIIFQLTKVLVFLFLTVCFMIYEIYLIPTFEIHNIINCISFLSIKFYKLNVIFSDSSDVKYKSVKISDKL